MQKRFLSSYERLCQTLLLSLIFMLAACSSNNASDSSTSSGRNTPTAGGHNTTTVSSGTATLSAGTPRPVPATTAHAQPGAQPCPAAVSDPSYWDPIIPTRSGVNQVVHVTCANLINPSLQALILVAYSGTGHLVDVYVYNNITDPHPQQLFKLQGLYEGDAKISDYNTILTAEVDKGSKVNIGQPNAALTVDLFREFKWSDGTGTFVPVSFPGIFPDLARYQAENDQQLVNQGHQPWKLDAGLTANALAVNLLHWPTNAQATVVRGGGQHDDQAVVTVKSPNPGSGTITVTLSRLEGNTDGGIWEAIAVESDSMSITAPVGGDVLSSPVTVTGMGNAFEGKIGTVRILDHLYNDIGQADATGVIGNGPTQFSVNMSYNSSFKGGAQEGIVALYAYSNADGSIASAVMLKELLS